jgi:hypothetical protein
MCQPEPGIDHGRNGGTDGLTLHVHEVDERIVQIKDDRFDHHSVRGAPRAGDLVLNVGPQGGFQVDILETDIP